MKVILFLWFILSCLACSSTTLNSKLRGRDCHKRLENEQGGIVRWNSCSVAHSLWVAHIYAEDWRQSNLWDTACQKQLPEQYIVKLYKSHPIVMSRVKDSASTTGTLSIPSHSVLSNAHLVHGLKWTSSQVTQISHHRLSVEFIGVKCQPHNSPSHQWTST